jgi:tetratricopeptide (TPR) repeat protein
MDISGRFDDRFRITGKLGAGGMGEVYRARDERLQRDVALKVLPEELAKDAGRLARFEQEARAAAALNHPNILALHDLGDHEGTPYLVTELLEGESLRDRIKKGPMPLKGAVELAVQLTRGLAAAHAKGIVHRDLKPENVFVTTDGTVKILDFGLARLRSTLDESVSLDEAKTKTAVTEAGTVLGTVGYMAPEQVRALDVDQRTDIFAFGCVLYEMLTGRRAFRRATAADTMSAILKEEPVAVEAERTDVSPALSQVLRRCLEKRPEDRFSSAHDLSLALQAAVSDVEVGSGRVPTVPRRRLGLLRIAGLAAVALGIAAVVIVWQVTQRTGEQPAVVLDAARVLVAEFENLTGDPSLGPMAALTADAVTQGLVELGEVEVVPAPDDISPGDEGALRAAARDAQAGTVVTGGFYLTGETLDLRARVIDASSGKPIYALKPETGPRDQPTEAIDRVRERVMSALMMHVTREPFMGNPPLYAAYQEYRVGISNISVDWRAVVEHLERAVELDPEFWLPPVKLVQAYFFVGDDAKLEAQRKHLKQNQDKLSRVDLLEWQYIEARIEGNLPEAFRIARERLTVDPRDFGWIFNAARLAVDLNRPREALETIGDVKKLDWDHAGTFFQNQVMITTAARAHHMLGQHEAELEVVAFGLELYPDLIGIRRNQLRALAALGRITEVDRVISESLGMREKWIKPGEAMVTAAAELRAHGYRDDALRVAARCADWCANSTGEDADPITQFACLWLAERRDEARALAEQTFDLYPTSRVVQGVRGLAAASAGDREVAEAMDRRLAAFDDPYRRNAVIWSRACIAAQLGERERAVELLHEAPGRAFELHVSPYLEPLHGYPPFEELLEPEG